jgi:hypothetical protein
MKGECYIILLLIGTLQSCKSVFLYETKNNFSNENSVVFDNDTVIVAYDFWEENGLVKFMVYNKLNIPIYIDWKKSSYIVNQEKFDYWSDMTTVNSVGVENRYFYSGNPQVLNYGFLTHTITTSTNVSVSKSIISKQERTTFIPPKSYIVKTRFVFLPCQIKGLELNSTEDLTLQFSPLGKNKIVEIKIAEFDKNNTPIIFRNFFTFSLTEDFKKENHINHEFWLSKVKKLPLDEFEGPKMIKRVPTKTFPFRSVGKFFIYEYKSSKYCKNDNPGCL